MHHAIRSLSAYHFDTFKFVERLEAEGFSREQSEAIMASLREVISERYVVTSLCVYEIPLFDIFFLKYDRAYQGHGYQGRTRKGNG